MSTTARQAGVAGVVLHYGKQTTVNRFAVGLCIAKNCPVPGFRYWSGRSSRSPGAPQRGLAMAYPSDDA
jgi:hypothetical protein